MCIRRSSTFQGNPRASSRPIQGSAWMLQTALTMWPPSSSKFRSGLLRYVHMLRTIKAQDSNQNRLQWPWRKWEAALELRRAIFAAEQFLQDCSSPVDIQRAFHSITKLDTREAYDVLIRDLLWARASFEVCVHHHTLALAGVQESNVECSRYIIEPVQECTSLLSSCTREEATQIRLHRDRKALLTQLGPAPDQAQQKGITFLLQKCQAHLKLTNSSISDPDHQTQLLKVCEIDPLDLDLCLDQNNCVCVGAGSFGEVYRSSWLGLPVAVKQFRAHMPKEEFGREASILAGLRSPFIVDMVGWCEKNGACMLVMEAVHTNLDKVIRYAHDMSMHAKVDIMQQISEGMAYLHRKKIIHRDIKPSNVLLEPVTSIPRMAKQGHARVKLCDFGLAKVKQLSAEDQSWYTTVKQGTGFYRAPEVLVDDDDGNVDAAAARRRKYTRKADVYSFAITCSQILGGYSATSECYGMLKANELRAKLLEDVRPNLPEGCPWPLRDLITRCWETEPERRPAFTTIGRTLMYIKFILMRLSQGWSSGMKCRFNNEVCAFDEEELRRRASEDEESH